MSNTLIGLGDVLNDLINLHNSNRLPNKLLLSGTQGIGKGVLSKHLLNYILSKNEPFQYDLKKLQINPSNKSFKLFERQNIAITSDATVISKLSFLGILFFNFS